MAEISKQALKVQNNTEFPNNNAGAITPTNLRTFNVNMIDSLVDEITYNEDSSSWNISIDALNTFTASASGLQTGSLLVTASASGNTITFTKGDASTFNVVVATGSIPDISNLNQATASLQAYTASANIRFSNLESTTASLNSSVSQLNASSASQQISINALNVSSASQQTSIDSLNSKTGSYATTGSNTFTSANTFTSISASSFISASEFIGNGSKITGITASISLPILDEGIPQGNAVSMNFTGSGISAIVVGGTAVVSVNVPDAGTLNALTASFQAYTASTDADLAAIHQATASLQSNSASVNTSITNVNSATASLFTSVNNINSTTASLNTSASLSLVTASFNNGTRNLTFTKGDTTTFSVNIPDVSGSAGDFVTTASFNAFTQSIDGRVDALEAATSSYITSAQTSSMTVLSASFAISSSHSEFADDATNSLYAQNTITTGKNLHNTTIAKGTPLYFTGSGTAGNLVGVYPADAGNPSRMPAGGIAGESIAVGDEGIVLLDGYIGGVNTTAFASGDEIFVAVGGGYTNVAPTGSALIQHLGNVEKSDINGSGVIQMAGEARGLPNIQTGYVWVGDSNGVPQAVATSSFIDVFETGSFATTGSNTFTGTQTINADLYVSGNTDLGFVTIRDLGGINLATTGSGPTVSYGIVTNPSNGDLVFNTNPNNGRLMVFSQTTGRMTQYSGLKIQSGDGITGDGSNGSVVLTTYSGSLFLTPDANTSDTASMLHVSSSSNTNNVNLIFKNNNTAADTIVSGSNNIFTNPLAPTAGFKRYVGGSNNYYNGSAIPQISGSMGFSPLMSRNIGNMALTARGPVSSSAWNINDNYVNGTINLGTNATNNFERIINGFTLSSNVIVGTVNATAWKTPLSASSTLSNNVIGGGVTLNMDSSSINFAGNTVQAALTVNNSYLPTTPSISSSVLAINAGLNIGSNFIYGSGSNTTLTSPRTIQNYGIIGTANTISASLNGDLGQINSTILLGQSLVVVASNSRPVAQTAADWGSVFVGRWNSDLGTTDMTAETVFAVGTGTSSSTRKTGFLIDSGSNTFVEGTLNVSGATSLNGNLNITGSLTASLQQGYVWVGDASGLTTTVATSSFGGGGGAGFPYTGSAEITGSLGVTGSISGFVNTLAISSNTASMNFNDGNFFRLQLVSGSTTHLTATNIRPGQTINLLVLTDSGSAAATGSLTFSPTFKFAGGFDYTPTAITASQDLVSFVTFDTTQILAASIKNLL